MSWRDTIRPDSQEHAGEASFRGVWFKTAGVDLETGRRTVVHEYPSRDVPYPEDMGKRAKHWRVEGYVIGDDYLDQRDELVDALEQPGPGELVHPRYGVLNVSVTGNISVKESTRDGGIARFSITFVEAGDNVFPGSEDDTVQELDDAGDECEDAADDEFIDELDLAGPASVFDDAIATVQDTMDQVSDLVDQVSSVGGLTDLVGQVSDFTGGIADLLLAPFDFVDGLRSIFDGLIGAVDRPRGALQQLCAIYDAHPVPVDTARAGSTADRIIQNTTAINALVRSHCLAAQARVLAIAISGGINPVSVATSTRLAAGTSIVVGGVPIAGGSGSGASASSSAGGIASPSRTRRGLALVAAATQLLRETPISTAAQAIALRDAVIDRIDAEIETTEPAPVKAAALRTLRATVAKDVMVRAELLRERGTFTPASVLPALVVAHRIYQDATRAEELIARNAVRNPNFVPAAALEVLQ